MKRGFARHCLLAVLAAMLSGNAPAAEVAAGERPVLVTLELHSTAVGGATTRRGTVSDELTQGETGELLAAVGQLEGADPLCASMTGGASRFSPSLLAGDGYVWRLDVSLESRSTDRASLRVAWHRVGSVAGVPEEARRTERLDLRLGQRRLLETVPFEPPNDEPSCRHERYHVELAVTPAPHETMAGRLLTYELWLARTREGVREEVAAAELLGEQAEEVPFVFPRVRAIDAAALGLDIGLRVAGTIRAWSTSPHQVAIRVEPILGFLMPADLGGGRGSWGRGSKRYEARLGETIELEIPAGADHWIVPATALDLPRQLPDGIEREGSHLRLDLGRLSSDPSYSLLVRVDVAD